ncbi:MAG: thermonuclease family protein [Dehalococcoidia bacterium]
MRERLTALVVVALLLAALAGTRTAGAQTSDISGELPDAGGYALVRWSGGPLSELVASAGARGCPLAALWATTPAGGWASYIPDAPAVANESFETLFSGGTVPAGQPLLLACHSARQPATVVGVVDGDTIDVGIDGQEQRLRLILVDTPEVFGGTECFGRAASDFIRTVLPLGTHVFLERDVSETDAFGRLLRYVWLEDGRLFNELIVAEGYATLATYPPDVKYLDRIRTAQQVAYEEGRGLWGECADAPPPGPSADVYYANCTEARAAGAAPLLRGEPGYRDALDGDKDGIACE